MITRYECPVGPCEWTLDDPGPDPSEGCGDTIEEVAYSALRAHMLRAEAAIRGHLEDHGLLGLVQEIVRLRAAARLEEQGALAVMAILLRRLGGTAEITGAEIAAESGTVHREPGQFSTRFTVTG